MKNIRTLQTVIILISIILSGNLFSQTNSLIQDQEKENNGFLIYFPPEIEQNTIDSFLKRYNSNEKWITKYSKVRYWKVINFPFTIDDSININNIQDLYNSWVNDGDIDSDKNNSNIGSISFNYKFKKRLDNLESKQNSDQSLCESVFEQGESGNNPVIIDVLDTGLDYKFFNMNNLNIAGSYNFINNTNNAQDDNGHGTHISSILAAMCKKDKNNIFVFESKTHNSEGMGKLSDIVKAIDKSIDMEADIINASWSFYAKETDYKTPLQIAIETAGNHGILFVTAAGNNAIDNDYDTLKAFPASYPSENILTVSSNSCDSTLSMFSNYGFLTSDICAWGENIPGYILNGQLTYLSGTSQSTAYISAVAAIIGSHLSVFDPVQVKKIILDGASETSKLYGLVNSEAVVNLQNSLSLLENNSYQPQNINFNSNPIYNNENKLTSAYPNPFNNEINLIIKSDKTGKENISLYDFRGRLKYCKQVNLQKGINKYSLSDFSKLKSGIYYIKIQKQIKKLIKI